MNVFLALITVICLLKPVRTQWAAMPVIANQDTVGDLAQVCLYKALSRPFLAMMLHAAAINQLAMYALS